MLSKLFFFPSEKVSTIKGKIFSPMELKVGRFFSGEANMKSQKLSL